MARIAGVDLPKEKRVEIGLTYIYGIGVSSSRKILEKGICLKGVTRSTNEDFEVISAALNNPLLVEELKPLVLSVNTIQSVNDVYAIYELEINNTKVVGKNLMKF